MNKICVKTSTPMNRLQQFMCLMVFCLQASLPAAAAGQSAPALAMQEQVRQWLAKTHGVAATGIEIAPLDSRVQVQTCARALQVDHPFASRDTVRVRCAEPSWQLYIQVSFNAPASPASPAGPAKAAAITVVVPRQLLPRGTMLKPEMLEETSSTQAQPGDRSLLISVKDAQYAELVRDIRAGEPLRSTDLRRATMVKLGQEVTMVVGEQSSFQVRVRLEAMQDGRMGEQIRLKNTESGRQISGVVVGPNQVRGL